MSNVPRTALPGWSRSSNDEMARGLGYFSLALGLSEGAEFRQSMGTVLIGGLLSSLILTLFLVPVVYAWVAGTIERHADRRALAAEHTSGEERLFVPQTAGD